MHGNRKRPCRWLVGGALALTFAVLLPVVVVAPKVVQARRKPSCRQESLEWYASQDVELSARLRSLRTGVRRFYWLRGRSCDLRLSRFQLELCGVNVSRRETAMFAALYGWLGPSSQ